ncbi:GntR family transcriptional regulator [Saccharopolyspora flava]|uniref:DNA-binding transcriptional regulator, GntR family n=1 Tax=Saccharopolyspora flava TaxID=95161 RepID=A0A1I6RKM3_9PSEU|nr:GntR family transcriptional regulator [Saccharopolyspora flava]SFS65279.1 DNA-binding transcriptional regulator, GntR family [Saccharopolyspora flava]
MVAKSDSIVAALRAEIIDGTIAAGSRLKEEAIASRFGVSRVPIREALLQLESEGFVNTEKYKGATVSARSERDVVELMQVRRGLEVLAASLAAEVRGGDEAENLRAVVERGRRAGESGAVDRLPSLIMEFHEIVARASGNAELVRMLDGLLRRIAWGFELEIEDRIDTSWSDHAAIATAILGGSPVQAGYLMGEHILKDEQIYRRQANA